MQATSPLLGQLQELLIGHVLPRLTLHALQSFGHSCAAARLAVWCLPDSVLAQMAQVSRGQACSVKHHVPAAQLTRGCLQAAWLPLSPGTAASLQLDSLAYQHAVVRAGHLQPAAESWWPTSSGWDDSFVQQTSWGDALVICRPPSGTLLLHPASLGYQELSANVEELTHGATVVSTAIFPPADSVAWCIAEERLVFARELGKGRLRVSVFMGPQLMSAFDTALHPGQRVGRLNASAGADLVCLVTTKGQGPAAGVQQPGRADGLLPRAQACEVGV